MLMLCSMSGRASEPFVKSSPVLEHHHPVSYSLTSSMHWCHAEMTHWRA